MKIHYPSMFDLTDELDKLNEIIRQIEGVSIIEITHSLIVISDGCEEYEYDSISEAIKEWEDVLLRTNRQLWI